VRCYCLKMEHSRELKSSLKDKNQELNLRKRGGSSRNGSQGSFFTFAKWPTTQGGRWESIYSPHPKKSHWGAFHRTCPVSPLDKSGGRL
jgi:hypothetical protein